MDIPYNLEKLRVLFVHNYYQQAGGEDAVFHAERSLLAHAGHEVITYTRYNDEIHDLTRNQRLSLAAKTIWNQQTVQDVQNIIERSSPHLVHVTNSFPLISPSIYYACQKANVGIVQNVQNYRLICPSATLLRDGHICEDCLGHFVPWPGIVHACYRGSRTQSAVVALLLTVHRSLGTWQKQVDIFIAATEFSRRKLIEGGLPAHKVVVKPNFLLADPQVGGQRDRYAIFVGRLAPEKGILLLLNAWRKLSNLNLPLKVIGDGPLQSECEDFVKSHNLSNVQLLGRLSNEAILKIMTKASFLIFPSTWYEGFPVTIVESLACGLPVIASRIGAMAEVINHEETGLLFEPGDEGALVHAVTWAFTNAEQIREMGRRAREEYERKYSAQRNYDLLMSIYESVLATKSERIR